MIRVVIIALRDKLPSHDHPWDGVVIDMNAKCEKIVTSKDQCGKLTFELVMYPVADRMCSRVCPFQGS